jgi:ribonuclease Z
MQLTISGYSTALFSTWYFIDELGLLFDAGDGLMSSLLQKSRKVKHAFISHADRDHLTGLLQFNQLNARDGFPVIYYPKDSASFPALEKFSKQFDQHVSKTIWIPIADGQEVSIRKDIIVQAIRNEHVPADKLISKSLSYKVFQTKQKVKQELLHLNTEELQQLIIEKGKEITTEEVRTNILSYSGDTPVEDLQRWNNSEILIHEATFLDGEEAPKERNYGNKHSKLEEVMEMVSQLNIGTLILGHFSSRYSPEQIIDRIELLCNKYAINFPVFAIMPGETVFDILNKQRAFN